MEEDNRVFAKELAKIESKLVHTLSLGSLSLNSSDESVLRWALSLARVSKVQGEKLIEIGHASDAYRTRLYELFKTLPSLGPELQQLTPKIYQLVLEEQKELLALFGTRLKAKALEQAIAKRPLALALAGGGGTAFIYAGAFQELEEAGIIPDAIAGSSMGALLGLYRAKQKHFDVEDFKRVASPLIWSRITQSSEQGSRFGLPASFRLNLHDIFAPEFQNNGRTLYLNELAIPFRVAVGGIADDDLDAIPSTDWLQKPDIHLAELRKREQSVIAGLLQLTQKPIKAIYLGEDKLTQEFDVLDAVGFSSAVPGIFHYDVLRHDSHMVPILRELMHQHGVTRLIDGGLVDNLPAVCVKRCLIDPFVLSLDAFSPNWKRHWLFLPLMHIAAENSKQGYAASDLTIAYQHVLSPINVVPSPKQLVRAIDNGIKETKPHVAFIKSMLKPLRNPFA